METKSVIMPCVINILILYVIPIDGKQYMIHVNQCDFDLKQQQATIFGLKYVRNVLSNVYLFEDVKTDRNDVISSEENIDDFKEYFEDKIIAVEPVHNLLTRGHSKIRSRKMSTLVKRSSEQSFRPNYGMNIQQAWSMGYTGKDVTVAVVDNGVNMKHPDLIDNSNQELSKTFVDTDKLQYSGTCKYHNELDKASSHGTMVAGLIAAKFDNYRCTTGVAFNASLVGLRVNNECIYTDIDIMPVNPIKIIAEAFKYERDRIDIYCYCKNFRKNYVENLDANDVLEKGAQQGREGKGSIFVISAGNNNWKLSDCNLDFVANSQYTITITSVGINGLIPHFAIPCTCSLASTYGKYTTYTGESRLKTTAHGNRCRSFSGTSASAALASGIIALTLQANPELTWRDVQHLIVVTSSHDGLERTETIQNKAGRLHSPYFGFGLMNASAMVQRALTWRTVPRQRCSSIKQHTLTKVRENAIQIIWKVSDENVKFLEHVTINLNFETKCTACISMQLCSPAGTCVNIVHAKKGDSSTKGSLVRMNWNYTTVSLWGESSQGEWKLTIKDAQTRDDSTCVRCAILNVYGTRVDPYAIGSESNEDDEGTKSYCGKQHKCGHETGECSREMVHVDSDNSAGAAITFLFTILVCLLLLSLYLITANQLCIIC